MKIDEAIEWMKEINHDYIKGDTNEEDMQKYTASYMAIKALEDEGLLEKAVKLTRDRLDAILNWLESPCPYKKTSYSQLKKMMGYEYARQKVFEILIAPEWSDGDED